jgi:hypothetical protein
MVTAAVAAGLYEVNVDFAGFGPSISVAPFDEFDAEFLNLSSLELFPLLPLPLSQDVDALCVEDSVSQVGNDLLGNHSVLEERPPEYFLYLITPPGQASEYVLRLPYFLSDMYFLGLDNVAFTTVSTWYTFSNMQSVVCVTFVTTSTPARIQEALQQVASWADTVESWVTTYKQLLPPSASPNVATVLCTTSSILVCDPEREEPVWLPHPTPVFQHTVTVTPPPAMSLPPDWVTHVCSHLDTYSLHSRLPGVHRHHIELRRPSPLPCFSPPALTLAVGDHVIYLRPSLDTCVCTTVRRLGRDSVDLESGDTPAFIAKFDPVQHSLLSELQPIASFLVV